MPTPPKPIKAPIFKLKSLHRLTPFSNYRKVLAIKLKRGHGYYVGGLKREMGLVGEMDLC